jgi:hypothetical protein
MLTNPTIYIYIHIALVYTVVLSKPIIGFIEKGFDSFRFERKGADNRDHKIIAAFRAHFADTVLTAMGKTEGFR